MTMRKSALHTLTFALLGLAGMALTSTAFARSHLSIGINLPGVSLGYHDGGRWHNRGYVGINYGPSYYGGYNGGYYAPAPAYYYDNYYDYAPPVVVYDGYYSRPYRSHHSRSYYRGDYRNDRRSYRNTGSYDHRGSSHRGSYYEHGRDGYRSH